MIVIASGVLVLGIVGAIAKILVGVFRINLEAVVVYFFLIRSLNKEIAVPLSPHVDILVAQAADNATRTTAF